MERAETDIMKYWDGFPAFMTRLLAIRTTPGHFTVEWLGLPDWFG